MHTHTHTHTMDTWREAAQGQGHHPNAPRPDAVIISYLQTFKPYAK